jgi:hypothetical protein
MQTVQLPALFGVGAGIDIPAGEKQFVIEDSVTLPVDVKAYIASAHAHYLAKEMKATATLPDGKVQPLLWIKDWDFNWQDRYTYKDAVPLPKGTRIDVRITYDNSADNPRNPSSPPKRAWWGEQSYDEMGSVAFAVTTRDKTDEAALAAMIAGRSRTAVGKALLDGTVTRIRREQMASQQAVQQSTK